MQATSDSPTTPAETNWRHSMVSPFSDAKTLDEDAGLVKSKEPAAPPDAAGQAASPKIPVSINQLAVVSVHFIDAN